MPHERSRVSSDPRKRPDVDSTHGTNTPSLPAIMISSRRCLALVWAKQLHRHG
jgi:hypothetical protein